MFKVEDLSNIAEGISLSLPSHMAFHTDHITSLEYQVYLERILRKPEIDAFAEELKPHQVILVYTVSSYFWKS